VIQSFVFGVGFSVELFEFVDKLVFFVSGPVFGCGDEIGLEVSLLIRS